jgi:hypothetical protein
MPPRIPSAGLVGDSCRLTVTHDQLRDDANEELYGGWPMILSGLKTLLETGEELTTPGSLRYRRGGAAPGGPRRPGGRGAELLDEDPLPRDSPRDEPAAISRMKAVGPHT